jgi:hypothetical protein
MTLRNLLLSSIVIVALAARASDAPAATHPQSSGILPHADAEVRSPSAGSAAATASSAAAPADVDPADRTGRVSAIASGDSASRREHVQSQTRMHTGKQPRPTSAADV